MSRGTRVGSLTRTPWRPVAVGHHDSRHVRSRELNDAGFTIIEMLVCIVILPVVIAAITLGLLSVLGLQSGVSNRLSDSGDAQVVSTNFSGDVQSAAMMTTYSSPQNLTPSQQAPCGSSTQLLGLQWGSGPTATEVSYVEVTGVVVNGTTTDNLLRNVCTGNPLTLASTTVIVHDLPSSQSPPAITGASGNASGGWTSTVGISGVTFGIHEVSSNYNYNLTAVPCDWTPTGSGGGGGSAPLVLLGTGPGELSCIGSGGINVDGEVVLNDSTLNPAADNSGSGSITATSFYTVAGTPGGSPIVNTGSGHITSTEPNTSGSPYMDPYAGYSPPVTGLPVPPGDTTWQGFNVYTGTSYQGPGIYTSPLTLTSSSPVTLATGIYILEAGIIDTGSGNLSSAPGGVLLYVTGGAAALTGSGSVSLSPLSPPQFGLPANLVYWQAKSDSLPVALVGSGRVGLIGGTIYAPSAVIGTTASGAFSATAVLAASLGCVGSGAIELGFPVPTVTAVSPNSDPSGSTITVTGTGFILGATTVSFVNSQGNKTTGTNVVVSPSNTLTVTVPNGTGTVDVTVKTQGGTSATSSADHFTYS